MFWVVMMPTNNVYREKINEVKRGRNDDLEVFSNVTTESIRKLCEMIASLKKRKHAVPIIKSILISLSNDLTNCIQCSR